MKLKDLLNEDDEKAGHKRLVASIMNMIKEKTGRAPNRLAVELYLKKLDKDDEFMKRIKAKSKKLKSDGYYWAAIRKRAASHFM